MSFLLVQIFEWHSMLFIISTQKNKRIEQIMYEVNNSNKIRTYEKILKFIFILLFVMNIFIYPVNYYVFNKTNRPLYNKITNVYVILIMGSINLTFLMLAYSMATYHKHEYELHK